MGFRVLTSRARAMLDWRIRDACKGGFDGYSTPTFRHQGG